MEQYEIPVRSCNVTLQTVLRNCKPKYIFIRWTGSRGGGIVLDEDLTDKTLELVKTADGFEIRINGDKKFLFEFKKDDRIKMWWGKRWSIAYKRIDEDGRMVIAHACYPNPYDPYDGPDDSRLPNPVETHLRAVNLTHYIEISFPGKIPIKRSYVMIKRANWYYWIIDVKKLKQGSRN